LKDYYLFLIYDTYVELIKRNKQKQNQIKSKAVEKERKWNERKGNEMKRKEMEMEMERTRKWEYHLPLSLSIVCCSMCGDLSFILCFFCLFVLLFALS